VRWLQLEEICEVAGMKRPAFQWYPGDWRRDTALQSCTIDARGLWVEMINLMHDGEPYGHLTAGGITITPTMLGTLTGVPLPRIKKLLAELEDRQVFSRTQADVIYSRRMVRDEDLRERRATYGKLGGNPNLMPKDLSANGGGKVTTKVEEKVEEKVKPKVNPNPTPATATAVASAVAGKELVVDARVRFSAAANRGLAEHPVRPQPIPPILPNSGNTLEATEAILAHGVPIEFAEDRIYELACTHTVSKVNSLKYFHDAVNRSWDERNAGESANGVRRRPASRPVRANGAGARNDDAIDAAVERLEALNGQH
jgi:hypothetical protein